MIEDIIDLDSELEKSIAVFKAFKINFESSRKSKDLIHELRDLINRIEMKIERGGR